MKKHMLVLLVGLGLFAQVAMAEEKNTSDRSTYIGLSTSTLTGDKASDSYHGYTEHTDQVQGRGTGLIIGVNLEPDFTEGVYPSLEISYAQANGSVGSVALPGGNAQEAKISNMDITAVISGRPSTRSRPFLRLGLGEQSIKYTSNGSSSSSASNVLVIVGAGVDVNIVQNLHARVEVLSDSIATRAAGSVIYFY